MRLYYATHDGHSRTIALRLAQKLAEAGIIPTPEDLAGIHALPAGLSPNEPIVIVAALRYGFHLPEAGRFLAAFRKAGLSNPLVVLSVNLTARKPGKRSAQGNAYLRRWLKWHKVTPVFAEAIAGRLDYPRYNLFDRLAIQFIMTLTRGPTDPNASFEFTDWEQVDGIAGRLAALETGTTPDYN